MNGESVYAINRCKECQFERGSNAAFCPACAQVFVRMTNELHFAKLRAAPPTAPAPEKKPPKRMTDRSTPDVVLCLRDGDLMLHAEDSPAYSCPTCKANVAYIDLAESPIACGMSREEFRKMDGKR